MFECINSSVPFLLRLLEREDNIFYLHQCLAEWMPMFVSDNSIPIFASRISVCTVTHPLLPLQLVLFPLFVSRLLLAVVHYV